jgi:polyphosphate kinase
MAIKRMIIEIIEIQLKDNMQAVEIDKELNNVEVSKDGPATRSQEAIYYLLAGTKRATDPDDE